MMPTKLRANPMPAPNDIDDTLVGIILRGVYDGVSVWQHPDGTYTNRWDDALAKHPKDTGIQRRHAAAQDWITRAVAGEAA